MRRRLASLRIPLTMLAILVLLVFATVDAHGSRLHSQDWAALAVMGALMFSAFA